MNSSRVSSLFSETKEVLFSSLGVLVTLLLEESSLSESGYILCSGGRPLLCLERMRGASYHGILVSNLGLARSLISISVVVFDSLTLLIMLDFLGLPEPGVWGPAVLVSGLGASEGARSSEALLGVEGSPVSVWESLGMESRVCESVGNESVVKVAVVMGSGARGYDERGLGVKGSEKTVSGVSG